MSQWILIGLVTGPLLWAGCGKPKAGGTPVATATNVAAPNWPAVTNFPVLTGYDSVTTNSTTNGAVFFRLKK